MLSAHLVEAQQSDIPERENNVNSSLGSLQNWGISVESKVATWWCGHHRHLVLGSSERNVVLYANLKCKMFVTHMVIWGPTIINISPGGGFSPHRLIKKKKIMEYLKRVFQCLSKNLHVFLYLVCHIYFYFCFQIIWHIYIYLHGSGLVQRFRFCTQDQWSMFQMTHMQN
jgi:hypothetical protein